MTTHDTNPPSERELVVHAYLDGELDPANALAVERDIAADPALAAERARMQALRAALREKLPPKPLPPHVRARVIAKLGLERARSRPSWMGLAASVALAFLVGSGASFVLSQREATDRVAGAILDDHLRSLMASQPFDVASSDRHTVKPWFNGRVAQAPKVVDLTASGFPLVGGRVDVVGGTPAPTLVYRHDRHLISLSALPAARAADAGGRRSINGYNIVGWREDGVAYWAVSDIGAPDLEAFARAFRDTPADR